VLLITEWADFGGEEIAVDAEITRCVLESEHRGIKSVPRALLLALSDESIELDMERSSPSFIEPAMN
jgi:hypothetical protein